MEQLTSLPFGTTTITIYNAYKSIGTGDKPMQITKWKRTVIPNCYAYNKEIVTDSNGLVISKQVPTVQLPLFTEFAKSTEWDNSSNSFTVQKNDLIVLKEVADTIENATEFRAVSSKYGEQAFEVATIDYNYGERVPLSHIKVGG